MSNLNIDHLQEQTVKDDAKVYIIEIQMRRIRGKAHFSFTDGGLAAFDLEEKVRELDTQLRDRFDLRYATEDPVTIGSLTADEEGKLYRWISTLFGRAGHTPLEGGLKSSKGADKAALGCEAVEHAAIACCADEACLKWRCWDYDEGDSLDAPRGNSEFPCREPRSLFVVAAREFVRIECDANRTSDEFGKLLSVLNAIADAGASDVRDGDVSDPANRFRARYPQSKWFGAKGSDLETRDATRSAECKEVTEGVR